MTPLRNRSEAAHELVWFGSLSRMLRIDGSVHSLKERLAEQCVRVALLVRARWMMFGLLSGYLFLAEYLLLPGVDLPIFHFEQWSLALKGAVLFFAVTYLALSLPCAVWRHCRLFIYLQVVVDLLFVTAAVHWSGGVTSWFWPAYLLVSLEAAFLLEKKREVWGIGLVGAVLYGALLLAEHFDYVATIHMPFMDEETPSLLFELLMWLWVAGLNAVVAFCGAFVMGRIRDDQRKLQENEEALRGFVDSASDLIFCCRLDSTLLYRNQVFASLMGVGEGCDSDVRLLDLTDEEGVAHLSHHIDGLIRHGDSSSFELRLYLQGADRVREVEVSLSLGTLEGQEQTLWGVCHDITERNHAQRELFRMAHHDLLTGLPNRILLNDRLQQARAFAHRMHSHFALLFLDLDRFKMINDTLGHAVGDELIRMIAQRLRDTLRESDTIARIGGDEFIVLIQDVQDRAAVCQVAEALMTVLSQAFGVREHELFVTGSAGIAIYPDHGDDVEALLQKADIAMYHAKTLGRNNYQFYESDMDQHTSRHFVIANSLRKAMDRKEFLLYYQPKLDVESGRIVAMEALVRWQHPELGLLAPTEFIRLAEENGLIMELGEWVLHEACCQNARWHAQGLQGLRVAVNLSGYQLHNGRLLEQVKQVLTDTGMPGDCLEFEITESVIMQDPDCVVALLNEITALGIHISIDDFGTGYSSLSHLKRFSVNTLKIDKAFVRDVEKSATDAAIATAIIAMGSSLKLKVIAEGVENEQQMEFLRDSKCDQVQGFLISRPLPADEVLPLLLDNWQAGSVGGQAVSRC